MIILSLYDERVLENVLDSLLSSTSVFYFFMPLSLASYSNQLDRCAEENRKVAKNAGTVKTLGKQSSVDVQQLS